MTSLRGDYNYSDGTNTVRYQRDDSTYDIENQLLTKAIYEIDGSGNLTQTTSKTQTFTYDTNGNQVSSTSPGAVKVDVHNRIYEFGNWRYRYDPFGRRIEKRNITSGGYWRRNYYVGVNCVSEWLTETVSGTPTEKGAYWLRVFGPYLVDQPLWANYDACADQTSPNDVCVGMSGYFHLDFIGTCVMVSLDDPAAYMLEQYRYDEYGEVTFCSGEGVPASPNVSAGDQTYLFTSREWDAELVLYYYRARHYRSSEGAFVSRDAVPFDPAFGAYSYAYASPANYLDSFGLQGAPAPNSANNPAVQAALLELASEGIANGMGSTYLSSAAPKGIEPIPGNSTPGGALAELKGGKILVTRVLIRDIIIDGGGRPSIEPKPGPEGGTTGPSRKPRVPTSGGGFRFRLNQVCATILMLLHEIAHDWIGSAEGPTSELAHYWFTTHFPECGDVVSNKTKYYYYLNYKFALHADWYRVHNPDSDPMKAASLYIDRQNPKGILKVMDWIFGYLKSDFRPSPSTADVAAAIGTRRVPVGKQIATITPNGEIVPSAQVLLTFPGPYGVHRGPTSASAK